MIITELFDKPPTLRSLDSDETQARFSIRTVAAYEAQIESETYVFMVEDVDYQGGWFSFGKVVKDDDGENVSYNPTNEKRPYPVLSAAVEVIRRFLADEKPYTLRLKAHVPAQNRLYAAMVKMLRPRLPAIYEVERDDDADWWEIRRTDLYETR